MYKFFLFLLGISEFNFAQQKTANTIWRVFIVDNISGKGIDRVTIAIDGSQFFYTDINGSVDIDKENINNKITISCVGYDSISLTKGMNFNYPDTIKLTFSTTTLNEIKIRSSTTNNIILGDFKKNYNSHRITAPACEYAEFIPNDNNIQGQIASIEYRLNNKLFGIEMPFKVGLYRKEKNSIFPGEKLINDSLIVYNPEKRKLLSVDISKYKIQLPPEGVIVTFETLSPTYYGKDSIWNNGNKLIRTPCIDMDLKEKDNYTIEYDKQVPEGAYSMVINSNNELSMDDIKYRSYLYSKGNHFAITLTINQ